MVSVSLARGPVLSKAKHFVLFNFISVFVFGLMYYVLQFIDSEPFFDNRAFQVQNGHRAKHFSIVECMHFSLVTQSTIGYGGMIPVTRACVIINSLQLMTIFWITATSINK